MMVDMRKAGRLGKLDAVAPVLVTLACIYVLYWLGVGGWHSFPNAEDLTLTSPVRSDGFINSVVRLLLSYDGRYFTNMLHGINPLATGWYLGYGLIHAAGIALGIGSLCFLLFSLAPAAVWGWRGPLLAALFYAVHFAVTPSLPHDLYWMVSSFVYMWPWTLLFLFAGSVVRYLRAPEGWGRNGWFAASLLSLVCGMGMNEMFLVLYGLLLPALGLWALRSGRAVLVSVLPLLAVGLASALFFVSCPGIAYRLGSQEVQHGMGHFREVAAVSASEFSGFLLSVFTGNAVLIPWAVVTSLLTPRVTAAVPVRMGVLAAVMLGVLTVLYLMTLAYYLPMGTAFFPERVYASVLYGLQLLLWATGAMAIHRLRVPAGVAVAASVILLVAIVGGPGNIRDLRAEFHDGTLGRFRKAMLAHYAILSQPDRDPVWSLAVIDPLPPLPRTIATGPFISHNRIPKHWNKGYERYFRWDEVRLGTDSVTKLQYAKGDGKQ
jgi:hypothetical protein